MDTLLIDDTCVLCNKTVGFILRRGGDSKFKFLSLYSEEGKTALKEKGFPGNYARSVVLIRGERIYTKSTAVLKVLQRLNGFFPVLYGFIIVPKPVRDWVYDIVARHRHRLF